MRQQCQLDTEQLLPEHAGRDPGMWREQGWEKRASRGGGCLEALVCGDFVFLVITLTPAKRHV